MNTKSILTISLLTVISMAGCATQEKACKDLTLASEQVKECQLLQRQIVKAKGNPLIRTELERRYEEDCINVRYYRDDQNEAICGDKAPAKQAADTRKKDNQ